MRFSDAKKPVALAAGILEDAGRIFFLCLQTERGDVLELPSALLSQGDEPLSALAAVFLEYAKIDAQVHEVVFEDRYNAGSRKRKSFVPALLFRVTAKKKNAKISPPYSGFRWLSFKDAAAAKLSRKSEWLKKFLLYNKGDADKGDARRST